jgi:hypothetical protein
VLIGISTIDIAVNKMRLFRSEAKTKHRSEELSLVSEVIIAGTRVRLGLSLSEAVEAQVASKDSRQDNHNLSMM